MHRRITELVNYVDGQRAALLAAVAAVPDAQWMERPGTDQWSVSELCEHLYMVERSCARVIGKCATEARARNHPAETETTSVLGTMDAFRVGDRNRKHEVPDRVKPSGGWSRERSLEALRSSRAELGEAIRVADGLALGTVRFTHLRFGELDLYQWILFIGQHEARHLSQAHEIIDRLATPHG
ncbi:MAG TPA: DinB family protein [Gemmatimonadaceae bacterium]